MTYQFSESIRAFLQEKKYLQNVSLETIVLYETSFKAFYGCDSIEDIKKRVVELRERGIKPVSVNTYLRHMKTYYLSLGKEWKLPWLKEEEKLLEILSADGIRSLMQFRPSGINQTRAWLVCLTILSTGLRASEVLGIQMKKVNLDEMSIQVMGKGGKERLVPFCGELRKHLFRYITRNRASKGVYLYGTKNDTQVSVRNLERDMKILGDKVGVSLRPHSLRHAFAVNYLRNGGNLEYLRRILSHTSLSTTQKYLRSLGIEAIQEVHHQFSPLSAGRGNGR